MELVSCSIPPRQTVNALGEVKSQLRCSGEITELEFRNWVLALTPSPLILFGVTFSGTAVWSGGKSSFLKKVVYVWYAFSARRVFGLLFFRGRSLNLLSS